jgi:hypothetical protein
MLRMPARIRAVLGSMVCAGGLGGAPAVADPLPCLMATGYALVGGHSNANIAGGDPAWLFDPSGGDVFCDPPHTGSAGLSGAKGAAIVEYLAGTGLGIATGAIANESANGGNRAHIAVMLFLEFRVVPDDPGATAAVPIVVRTRNAFGRVAASASGTGGSGSNSHVAYYEVHQLSHQGLLLEDWTTDGLAIFEGGTIDFEIPIAAPPNTPLYFVALVNQQSYAYGRTFGSASGAADASSTVTLQVETEAAASIVFEVESTLGIPPPMLGVVTVPEAGGSLAGGAALAALHAARRRAERAG